MIKLQYNLELKQCPHCSINSPNLASIWNCETTDHKKGNHRWWNFYKCQKCGGVVIAASQKGAKDDISEFYPVVKILDDSIPHPAFEYLSQAIETLHAPAGSIMLSASAIDAMLKSKKYLDGKLFSRINKAAKDNLITKDMATWAHEVRLGANEQRHSDNNTELPTYGDAQKTIDFALALAEYLFVLPSKVKSGLKEEEGQSEGISDKDKQ